MGLHLLDTIIIVGIALLIFGPKTLQSLSRNAGRGVAQAKDLKDKLMSEIPVEELAKVNETISQIPTSPQQVAQKLIFSSPKPGKQAESTEHEAAEAGTEAPGGQKQGSF